MHRITVKRCNNICTFEQAQSIVANTPARQRVFALRLVATVLAGLLSAHGGVPDSAPAMAIRAPHAAWQTASACQAFDSRIWAQAVFDDDPAGNAALDPDRDGFACEELPPGAAPALWTDEIPAGATPVALASIADGDTIEVVVDGRPEAVRLVGVDAPESGGPYQDGECFGLEGAEYLDWLLGFGGRLFVESDREDRDRFDRLLRWVWLDLGDGEVYLLNEAIIRAGYAERFRDTPNRRYVDELIAAEAFARRYRLGLWGACETGGVPDDTPPISATSAPGTTCDPAYPDVCIPSPPPDLECGDIPHARFRVLPPDPHTFDGNGDGIGCEGPG